MHATEVERLDWTTRLCRRDPYAAAVRKSLLGLERELAKLGWDGERVDPKLFQLDRAEDQPEVELSWCSGLQATFASFVDAVDGNVGRGMCETAGVFEDYVDALRTGKPLSGIAEFDEEALAAFQLDAAITECMLREAGEAGDDLQVAQSPGYTLYGLGMAAVAWTMQSNDPLAKKLFLEHRLHEYEHRGEGRIVYCVGRDGILWVVRRERDGVPIALAYLPESDGGHAGSIVNGLSRLLNAMCSNPVPIWPNMSKLDVVERPPANPLFKQ